MRTVHGVNASPFVRKVRVALEEKGLDYELNPVMPFNPPPEFMAISPLGKIPVYQEGQFTIPDSSVIIDYIERSNPDTPLYPADSQQRAEALFLEEYCDTALVSAAGTVFLNRIIKPRLLGEEEDKEAVRQALEEELPGRFDYLEARLDDDAEFLVGDSMSIADIAVASPFVNLAHAGENVDASRWPKLAAYLERIL